MIRNAQGDGERAREEIGGREHNRVSKLVSSKNKTENPPRVW
jgi:hypothetical protein